MNADDLKKSYIFEMAIQLQERYTFQFVCEHILANTCYLFQDRTGVQKVKINYVTLTTPLLRLIHHAWTDTYQAKSVFFKFKYVASSVPKIRRWPKI